MSDTDTPRLTAELVVMAIQNGMLDDGIVAIRETVRTREEVLELRAATNLNPGDQFLIKDCRPLKWNGTEVRFTGRENSWLICQAIYNQIASTDVIRLKPSHVGTITRKAGE